MAIDAVRRLVAHHALNVEVGISRLDVWLLSPVRGVECGAEAPFGRHVAGGHFIYSTATEAGKLRMHGSAYRTCARCKQHGDDYATYNDYYHGRAYKNGASDAPACWQCHEAHGVLPSNNPASSVSSKNVGATCGQEGCHKGSSEEFGAAAGELIHRTGEAQEENALLQLIARVRGLGGD